MEILDGHIHAEGTGYDCVGLRSKMDAAEVDGGVVISSPPLRYDDAAEPGGPFERLEDVLRATSNDANLHPLFWIDPTDDSAVEQVDRATTGGILGFKVICSTHSVGDSRAMDTYRTIAAAGKPVLFHSGILWDGMDSSRFNRPAEFESLIDIPKLRFSLAHIGWPWCDELIAVYGKFLAARTARPDQVPEMFIDTTPGTPAIYRKEALEKLYTIGYDISRNVVFGTDCTATVYRPEWAREWITRDSEILTALGLENEVHKAYFAENIKRFLGLDTAGSETVEFRPLRQAE